MATRSMPTPRCNPVVLASSNLVPTPSVAATKTGSWKPAALVSNSPPNPPRSVLAPARFVRLACGAISPISASPSSISTPASLYFRDLGCFCPLDMLASMIRNGITLLVITFGSFKTGRESTSHNRHWTTCVQHLSFT